MRGKPRGVVLGVVASAGVFLFSSPIAKCQNVSNNSAESATPVAAPASDVQELTDTVRELQSQMKILTTQLSELRSEEQGSREEVRELRSELDAARNVPASRIAGNAAPAAIAPAPPTNAPASATATQQKSVEDQMAELHDDLDIANARIAEQSQTKVESGSKYRVRLSGIVLFNMFGSRGQLDNLDVPEVATPPEPLLSDGAFGGTLRQSQLGLEAFGPDVAGARTSANITFDFAGGFPNTQNGAAMGIARLRTGTIRMDWDKTSLIAGQDSLFFSPASPTSLASLAVPALSYSGNLWIWTPQVRIERRIDLSQTSSLQLQAGILDSLTGDVPPSQSERYPSWGEQSGQPAYAARISWKRRTGGQDLTVGMGGYYSQQSWGFGRDVNAWAGTADVTLPLGSRFAFSGEFYRGRAVGGIGGGIGQTILLSGSFVNPATTVQGLQSMGGWVQFKFKPLRTFEINAALGDDNPFASQLRRFPASHSYYGVLLSRNLSPFVNFIYQPRSDILFSAEYRHLQTTPLDSGANTANIMNLSVGYLF